MLGLIIREPWISKILAGRKVWEIRSRPTNIRGRVKLIRGGSGLVVGTVEVIDCIQLTKRKCFAWVLRNPVRFIRPQRYRHPNGAVIWVNLSKSA